ncbi:MAG: ABC transporter permease subunit [Rubritalea sp.]
MRKLAIFLVAAGMLSAVAWARGLDLPTFSWFYDSSEVFGYTISFVMVALGGWMLLTGQKHFNLKPMTERRLQRFKSIGRGYWAFVILMALILFACLDQLVVGKRALLVMYDGKLFSPALMQSNLKNKDFGILGNAAESEVNFRELKKKFSTEDGNWVMMPPVPFDPTKDMISAISKDVEIKDGLVYNTNSKSLYNGQAATLYSADDPEAVHMRYKYRKGKRVGEATGKNEKRQTVYTASYVEGEMVAERYTGEGAKEDFLKQETSSLRRIFYNPTPASYKDRHYLGTDSKGNDIFAYLYGGLQVNLKAAAIYIPIVYLVGITIGLLMGFYGGTADIVIQRIIEIFSNIPFLFVILILSGLVPNEYKGLGMILTILVIFGWMGLTYLMRTAALKEKSRDYVAAARVMGASTPRIIFKHILPNSVAIIVTVIPFSVSSIILSLTSLDYLGFGLPPRYATWGSLLQDGLANLSSPWIVGSAFFMLVLVLILVTFIGEAVREAFDPKKFTTYR